MGKFLLLYPNPLVITCAEVIQIYEEAKSAKSSGAKTIRFTDVDDVLDVFGPRYRECKKAVSDSAELARGAAEVEAGIALQNKLTEEELAKIAAESDAFRRKIMIGVGVSTLILGGALALWFLLPPTEVEGG